MTPVAEWLPLFSRFTDEEILRAGFAVYQGNLGSTWCKFCDAPVVGETGDAHLSRHARELAAHRRRQRAAAARARTRNLRHRRRAA